MSPTLKLGKLRKWHFHFSKWNWKWEMGYLRLAHFPTSVTGLPNFPTSRKGIGNWESPQMEVGNRKLGNDLNGLFPLPNFPNRPPNFLEGKWEWELPKMEMGLGNFSTWKWEVGRFPK
jgi:hypothetical protein